MREWTVNVSILKKDGRAAYRQVAVFTLFPADAVRITRRILETPGMMENMGHKVFGPLTWDQDFKIDNESHKITVLAKE